MSNTPQGFRITKVLLLFLSACGRPIEPQKMEILERVLIYGETQPAVAERFNVSQQYISKSVKSVYDRLASQFAYVPEELVIRTVGIHPTLIKELEALQAKSYKLIVKEHQSGGD